MVEYSCLGDWFVDKNHFFAVANTKESRKDEKYRCFLKNRDDDLYFGVSITAECNTLKTVEKSPERLRVTPGTNIYICFSLFILKIVEQDFTSEFRIYLTGIQIHNKTYTRFIIINKVNNINK